MANFTLTFATDGAAFESGACAETARILRDAAHRIESDTAPHGTVRDINGNSVGYWRSTDRHAPDSEILSTAQAMAMLARTEMRDFEKGDWDMFAGCETPNPLIGYRDDYVIVLDGDTLNIIHNDDKHGGQIFKLVGG